MIVDTSSTDFKITPRVLADAITPRTRAIILNSPSNPTGGVMYSQDELSAIAEIVVENDLFVVSDEIYERLLYRGGAEFVSIAAWAKR